MLNSTPNDRAERSEVKCNEVERAMSDLLCVVSPHEKGFWQADIYHEGWAEGLSPDWFCTGKIGGTKEEIIAQVKNTYPSAKFTDGITEDCIDCGEEYFELEHEEDDENGY